MPMVGSARVSNTMNERWTRDEQGARLKRESRRRRAPRGQCDEHADANHAEPGQAPALAGLPHLPKHLLAQRIEAFAVAQAGGFGHRRSQWVSKGLSNFHAPR